MEHKAVAEAAPLEFSSDLVKIKAHFKPACKVELEVEAAPSIVQEAHKKAIKLVGKEVTIAGFRKGKAPENLIETNYPKQVESELEKVVSDLSFRESIKACKIPVLNNELKIGYNMKSHSLQEGAKLILFFETEPTIPTIDPQTITLKKVERPEVNDEKVEETIRQVQLFFAEWKRVDGRPIQEHDFVLLDVDVIEEEPARPLFSGVRFEVTDRSMAKWMKDLILGHKRGEVLEGTSVPDADAKDKDKDLTPKKVRVRIIDVETAKLPELTDEFAKKMGVPSVQEMRTNIEKLLNDKADGHVKEKMREEVSEALLNDFKFDVPGSLIDREVRFRMQQLLQDSEYAQHWNSMTNEAKKRTVGSIAEQSEKAVRMFYLCRKILADAKINISPNDVPKIVDTPLNMLLGERRDVHPQGNTEVHQAEAFSRLLLEKAEDYIIAHAKQA